MPQVIKIRRGTSVPANGTLTEGELGLLMTAPGNLYAGDTASVTLPLVTPLRQVELAGAQDITGAKRVVAPGTLTLDVAQLLVPGGSVAGDVLTTTNPVTGALAFVTPTVAPTTDWEEDLDMDALTPATNEFVNAANVRALVGGQLSSFTTSVKTGIIPAVNSLKAQVDQLALGGIFVGTYDAAADTALFTAASGGTNGPLPAAGAGNTGWYVIVTTPGTVTGGSAPDGTYGPSDWVVSNGSVWTHLDFSASAAAIAAANVSVTAITGVAGDDVQEVLENLAAENEAQDLLIAAGLDQAEADLLYEPIIAPAPAVATEKIWQGDKTWVLKTSLPPSTAQIAIDAGQDTRLTAVEGAIALLPTDAEIAAAYEPIIAPDPTPVATQYWSGLKTWVPLPAATVDEPPISLGLTTQVWQGDKTWVLKTDLPITTAQAAVDALQDTAITGKLDSAVAATTYEPIIVPDAAPVATQYWSGLKTWLPLPAGTAPPLFDQVSIVGTGLVGGEYAVALVDGGTWI